MAARVPPADPAGSVPAEIHREAAYLATARAALRLMHHQSVETGTPLSVSPDSDEVWHNTVYRLARRQRAQALVDLPDVPLFFGRLDYRPGTVFAADPPDGAADLVYIGRRHVHDQAGHPLVIDWRAPVSIPFYQATRDHPQGVRRRRRFGFSGTAELTGYEDDPLVDERESALVTAEIERPRSGPMRDIVATIQPDQDNLVRAPLQPSLCIQGAPGTGKTAVGLHRLAYLLYTERARLGRNGGVAVVGPNRSFLGYIRRVLPALGELDISQTTIEELVATGRRAAERPPARPEDPEVTRLKGDARMAAVLRRALWRHVGEPEDGLVYVQGSYRYRVGREVVGAAVAALRGTTRYRSGRAALAQRLAHLVLVQMEARGAAPDDREQAAVARSAPVKRLLDQVWPALVPEQVLFRLLAEPAFRAAAAQDELTAAEQRLLGWPRPPRSWRSARWSAADAVLRDELADLIDRPPALSHVVIDEAQDLSPMQCRALGRRCVDGSLTVLGDLAQGTAPGAVDDWPALLAHLGKPDARLTELEQGFRVPAEIIDYAARLLPELAPGLRRPRSLRRAAGALQIARTSGAEFAGALAAACRAALRQDGSVGLIAADADAGPVRDRLCANDSGGSRGLAVSLLGETPQALEAERLVCVPASLAKGLEFDAVIVAEPARIVAAEPRGLHRLYVVLTRAVTSLHIVHTEPLPEALRSRSGTTRRPA